MMKLCLLFMIGFALQAAAATDLDVALHNFVHSISSEDSVMDQLSAEQNLYNLDKRIGRMDTDELQTWQKKKTKGKASLPWPFNFARRVVADTIVSDVSVH